MTQSLLALEPMRFKCQYRHQYQQNIHLNSLISEMRRNNSPECYFFVLAPEVRTFVVTSCGRNWRYLDVMCCGGCLFLRASHDLLNKFFVFKVAIQILCRVCPFQDVVYVLVLHLLTQVTDYVPELS